MPSSRSPSASLFPDFTEVSDPALLCAAPVVSVVVGTYLHEAFLEETIDSIAAQVADFDYEIVIAEDTSPDRTRDVAIAVQKKYPDKVRVVFTPGNKGGGRNAIFAVSFCRGAYIAWCEGDDFWIDEAKLARQVAALERLRSVDMGFTRGYRFYSDGARVLDWSYGDRERVVPTAELFRSQGWIAPTASLIFRASILKPLPDWFADVPFGDVVLILAGSARGGAHYDPPPTICYRIGHPQSFSVQLEEAPRAKKLSFYRAAIDTYERACRQYGVPLSAVSHRTDDYRLSLAKLYFADRHPFAALKALVGTSVGFLAGGAWRRLIRSRAA